MIMAGYYGLMLVIHVSFLRPSILIFCFWMITKVNVSGISPNLVYALILWRSGLGLLMGKLCQFMTELSAGHTIGVRYYYFTILYRIYMN